MCSKANCAAVMTECNCAVVKWLDEWNVSPTLIVRSICTRQSMDSRPSRTAFDDQSAARTAPIHTDLCAGWSDYHEMASFTYLTAG